LVIVFSAFLASQLGRNTWTSTFLVILFGVVGIAGLAKLRDTKILELGVIGLGADMCGCSMELEIDCGAIGVLLST
jgi:hypothetical protein